MELHIHDVGLSLIKDNDGVFRVGGTRVMLDTVIAAFNRGATPEEIAQQYPSLELADIYAIVAYYLRNRKDVENYLIKAAKVAAHVRADNEEKHPISGLRDRLLARRATKSE